jgi:hypothetical protein
MVRERWGIPSPDARLLAVSSAISKDLALEDWTFKYWEIGTL